MSVKEIAIEKTENGFNQDKSIVYKGPSAAD
jgi:hypothetical protein